MDLMNWAVIYSDVPEDKRDVLMYVWKLLLLLLIFFL